MRFWAYFLAALQMVQPGIGGTALAMLQSPQPPAIETILTDLLNEIALLPADVVLVLDDYHVIQSTEINRALAYLLENLPLQLHIVIASRSSPPLPLPLLRGRRELVEVSPAELRFTTTETSTFLNQVMSLELAADDVAQLEDLTEGWIAGLQLAALSMQGVQDIPGFIDSFSGEHRYVFDYLAQEVLNRQRQEIRQFLLSTSVLERLNAYLCDAVIGHPGSQSLLEELERANLFLVPLDQERRWYRYHHLFSDFLKAQLKQEATTEEIALLHKRASLWYEAHDSISEAVEQALAAGEYRRAADLVNLAASRMFANSELTTILEWLDQLPTSLVQTDLSLSLTYAWALLATSQFEAVEPRLQDIEAAIGMSADGSPESRSAPEGVRAALAEVACMRANLCFHQMQIERLIDLSHLALDYLGEGVASGAFQSIEGLRGVAAFNIALAYEITGNVRLASQSYQETIAHCTSATDMHLLMLSTSHLGGLQVSQGNLHAAASLYQKALEDADRAPRPSPLSGQAHVGLANVLYEWNDLDGAIHHLDQGIGLGRQWANWETLLPGYLGLAHVRAARREVAGALAVYDELFALSHRLRAPWGLPVAQADRARIFLRSGNLDKASEWARICDLDPEGVLSSARQPEAIVFAQVLLAQGDVERSGTLVQRLQDAAEVSSRTGQLIAVLTVKALVLSARSDEQAALATLLQALALAEPQGFMRTFIDEGAPVQALLARLPRTNPMMIAYIDRLLAAFQPTAGKAAPSRTAPDGPLSEREITVLRLMADGLSNQEIANQLVVSLNTVKSHIKHIYLQLGVHTRTQAVAQARQHGLLS
jgi:LuxR family maltose regulon positive regulatory protein